MQVGREADELSGTVVDQPWLGPAVTDTLDVGSDVDWSTACLSGRRDRLRTRLNAVDDLLT